MATGRTDETASASRRSFIQGTAVVATGVVAASCSPAEAEHVYHNGDLMAPDRTPHPPPGTPTMLAPGEAYDLRITADGRRSPACLVHRAQSSHAGHAPLPEGADLPVIMNSSGVRDPRTVRDQREGARPMMIFCCTAHER